MARPREFDTEEVLNRATEAFWAHGFEATSVRDLVEATGLQKGSLYQAFGDKHRLFMKVLERYSAEHRRLAQEIFRSVEPGRAIEVWLGAMMDRDRNAGMEKGCLLWNTVSELAPHDSEVHVLIDAHFTRMLEMVSDVIKRGQAERAYRTDLDAITLATFLFATAAGLVSMQKGNLGSASLEDLPRLMLSTLAG
jgi:TetR/AcrR family transcriptional repressor of nem operon